jgi:diguanylate cyclase (GGDEF)-like protein/PAS domain S-box-containing protein
MQEKGLRYRLIVIDSLVLVLPLLVLTYIFYEQNITFAPSHLILVGLVITLSLMGIFLLQYVFAAVSDTAKLLTKATEDGEKLSIDFRQEVSELNEISSSFSRLMERFENMTESLNQTKEALHESEELYKTLAEKSFAGVYVVQDGFFKFINNRAASYAGYLPQEMVGMKSNFVVHPEDWKEVKNSARSMLRGERSFPYELRIITKQKETRWLMETVTPIHYEGKTAVLGNSMDITERKRYEEEIQAMSMTDHLTGLYNRRGFMMLAEQQLKLAQRTKKGVVVLFADLDDIKRINDALGHKKGDEAITEAADIFREIFRGSDIIARIGGDEFAVLANAVSKENLEFLRYRLQVRTDIHNAQGNRDYHISMSIGMAFYDPENPSSIDELVSRADGLMYEEKKKKRIIKTS